MVVGSDSVTGFGAAGEVMPGSLVIFVESGMFEILMADRLYATSV